MRKTSRPNLHQDGWHYFSRARWCGGFRLRLPPGEEAALRARWLPRRELRRQPARRGLGWLVVPASGSPECPQWPAAVLLLSLLRLLRTVASCSSPLGGNQKSQSFRTTAAESDQQYPQRDEHPLPLNFRIRGRGLRGKRRRPLQLVLGLGFVLEHRHGSSPRNLNQCPRRWLS